MGDLRHCLNRLSESEEVQQVEGASWEEEIGALTQLIHRKSPEKALLFDHIPDYSGGKRVLTNYFNMSRLARVLQLPGAPTEMEITKRLRDLLRENSLIATREVEEAAFLANVDQGDHVDLFKFPMPKWHEQDPARHFGNSSLVIVRDPDNGRVNVFCGRLTVHDSRHASVKAAQREFDHLLSTKYLERGRACPIVVVISPDPLLCLVSQLKLPINVSAYEFAGGIRRTPVDVRGGVDTGLPIPAGAEIVFEGTIGPGAQRTSECCSDWSGYYVAGKASEPVLNVSAMYYRTNPIILGDASSAGGPSWQPFITAATVWNQVEAAGVPDIQGVWAYQVGGGRLLTIVSLKQLYGGHSRQAGLLAAQCQGGVMGNRWTIVVDQDVALTDIDEVLWAALTRCDPGDDMEIICKCVGDPEDPLTYPADEPMYNNRVLFDACRSYERRDTFPAVATTSKELAVKTKRDWPELFPVRYPVTENSHC